VDLELPLKTTGPRACRVNAQLGYLTSGCMTAAVIPTQRFGLFCEPWLGTVGLISVPQWREGHAFAGRRKRLVQQRFERVGCPTAINGLTRDFQGPIQAREVTLGYLLAEQGLDRGGQGGRHGTLGFLGLRRASSNGPAASCARLRQEKAAILSDGCSLSHFPEILMYHAPSKENSTKLV